MSKSDRKYFENGCLEMFPCHSMVDELWPKFTRFLRHLLVPLACLALLEDRWPGHFEIVGNIEDGQQQFGIFCLTRPATLPFWTVNMFRKVLTDLSTLSFKDKFDLQGCITIV